MHCCQAGSSQYGTYACNFSVARSRKLVLVTAEHHPVGFGPMFVRNYTQAAAINLFQDPLKGSHGKVNVSASTDNWFNPSNDEYEYAPRFKSASSRPMIVTDGFFLKKKFY